MQTLESLRRQIDTSEDLHGIVRTMKSLAAVSIRQYERAADALEGYADTVHAGMQAVLRQGEIQVEDGAGAHGPAGVVLFGSDHGLCGRFNADVVQFARTQLPHQGVDLTRARHLAVGGRAADRMTAEGLRPEAWLTLPGSVNALVETAYAIIERVERWRADGVETVMLVHNRRGRQAPAEASMHQMLPLHPDWLRHLRAAPWPSRGLPTFRADAAALFAGLVRQHLFVTVFRATAESLASEHASRLSSMQAAEGNIEEHLEELRAAYRHSRQQSITEELLDIVSGFEALGGEAERA